MCGRFSQAKDLEDLFDEFPFIDEPLDDIVLTPRYNIHLNYPLLLFMRTALISLKCINGALSLPGLKTLKSDIR